MNGQEAFNNELNEIRSNMLIEVSHWWGHTYTGYAGTIITNNKEVYIYQFYHREPKEIEGKGKFINKIKELSESEFDRVVEFVKNEIIPKEFMDKRIFDAGYSVAVNYNGINKKINNNKGFDDEPEIYDLADKLLKEIIK